MKILKIKKEGQHYLIYLSDEETLALKESVFVRHNLYKGKDLDEEDVAAIAFDSARQEGIDLALKKLTNRKTEQEIRELLIDAKLSEQVIDEVVAYLSEYGFLDDEAYALLFSRDKRNINGYGPVKIAYALRRKGIDDECIARGLEEYTTDSEKELIQSIVEKKYLRGGELNKSWEKIVRFLLSRGFHYDAVKDVLSQWKN
ncbi:regulatory protein RecX [Aedoeadaptatus acetigenes]|uniref:regulatory protein RecX n=1 Tax=Aedoeadaptatus acetigenes TaxID=2981723 RepID=UPI0022658AE6|nr:RecX family transcriptional regulator [Aedoeadaptatus acetigenes]MCU6786972.1 RecX family transcriptional regulator [Aedoeadaptatus acetigenes]